MPDTVTLEQVQNEGWKRLFPSLTNPSWLVLRKRRELFRQWLRDLPGDALCVLDVGGRLQPYRVLLEGRCAKYIAVDLRRTPLVNVIGRAEQLPFADSQFDLVFCTQMLEYVAEPRAATAEIHRALKPGGVLLLSAPAVWPQDSEVDCWRFLPPAFRYLLSDFRQLELAPEGNSFIGLMRTINIWMVTFARLAFLARLLQFTVVPVLNLLGVLLQFVVPPTDDRFAANFSVKAQK
jgi:SAM-dependent methyltransferase